MSSIKIDAEKKIIESAKEIFIEKGLQGARMQEIADRAGINKALLHYYFRSKELLFDAVFQEAFKKIIPEFSKILSNGKDFQGILESVISFYNNFFIENPYLPQFFFHEIWQHPDKLAAMINSQEVKPSDLKDRLKDQIPKIDDSEYLTQHMIANVMGMCLFPHIARPLFQRLFFENNNENYDEFLSERTDFLVKMIGGVNDSHDANFGDNPDDEF